MEQDELNKVIKNYIINNLTFEVIQNRTYASIVVKVEDVIINVIDIEK